MVQPTITQPTAADAEPSHPNARAQASMEFLSWTAATVAVLLPALAGVVLWRRLAGALQNPLPVVPLVATGVLVALLAGGVRLAWRPCFGQRPAFPIGRLVTVLPGVALVALAFAWSLPGTSAYGLVALWAVIVLEESYSFRGVLNRRAAAPLPKTGGEHRPLPTVEARLGRAAPVSPPQLDRPVEGVLQQLTRTREADGTDRLGGWVRAPFAAGQRTESIHLAFCPAFEQAPRLEVQQRGGPAARVKTAQLLPYGARLDLKLAATAESPDWVLLEFTAESPPGGSGLLAQT